MQKARQGGRRPIDLALSSLIEGEATLAMIGAGMDDWDGSKAIKADARPPTWTAIFSLILPFMSMAGGARPSARRPPILSESR